MPITINDCMKCGRPPKFETEYGEDHTFEWQNFWFKCYPCNRVGMVSEMFEAAIWNWNSKNTEGGLYADHDQ